MNSLSAHRAIIGILIVALIVALLKIVNGGPPGGHDGDPSGLDIVSKGTISLKVQPNGGGLLCLSGSACDVRVEMHYLNSPPPNCTDSGASGCTGGTGQPRTLPPCNVANEDLCLSAASMPAPAVAPSPTPLTVQIQDNDGWRSYDTNGQFIITLTAIGTKARKNASPSP